MSRSQSLKPRSQTQQENDSSILNVPTPQRNGKRKFNSSEDSPPAKKAAPSPSVPEQSVTASTSYSEKPKRKKIADRWSQQTIAAAKAGIFFDPKLIRRNLRKGKYAKTIKIGSAVYMSAVLEYLVAEIVELSGHAARDNKKSSIGPRHIMMAIRNDAELDELCRNVTIPESGVIPMIHQVLQQKSTRSKKR